MSVHVYKDFIKKVRFFEFADEIFIREICTHLKPEICFEGDLVLQEFDIADKVYFI